MAKLEQITKLESAIGSSDTAFRLELSLKEAAALRVLVGKVGGASEKTARGEIDGIYNALNSSPDIQVKADKLKMFAEGNIFFIHEGTVKVLFDWDSL